MVVLVAALLAPAAVAAPLKARAGFDDSTVQFGDPIHTRVTVVVDGTVRAGSVRIVDDPAPLTTVSPARTSRVGEVIEVTRDAMCLTSACVSDTGSTTPKLTPALVNAKLKNGRTVQVVVHWPQLTVRGRVTGGDLSRSQPPFRASLLPPAPTYRTSPSTLAWLLDAAAIVLGLVAVVLVLVQVRRWMRSRGRAVPADELERALRLAREAERRAPPDRRRAAGLLARLLGERDAPLAGDASDLAWAKPQPEPGALESLVGEVERARE
ncbi:MAG TPA: hypothetical protein VGH82_14445 [Gaiellaceae bacterium]